MLRDDLRGLVNGDSQDNFGTRLLKLVAKADKDNREKLRGCFPNAVKTYEHFMLTGSYLELPYD